MREGEYEHLARLESSWQAMHERSQERGEKWQRARREAEQHARESAVEFSQELGSVKEASDTLGLSRRTLIRWRGQSGRGLLKAALRGRPLRRSHVVVRNELLATLNAQGPTVGVKPLCELFPELSRGEVADLVRRYKRLVRKLNSQILYQLNWTRPGTVWAMDHAFSPEPIDGYFEAILAVRDLSSGEQLLWQPVRDETAEETLRYLEALFSERGVPLVLKSDNGPGFRSERTQSFLTDNKVTWLASPYYTPSYNGSCEAGIGVLKKRTAYRAALAGRPGLWTSEDLEEARDATNRLRAINQLGDVIDTSPTAQERTNFRFEVERRRREIMSDLTLASEILNGIMKPETVERQSVKRALVACGYLNIRRGRISLPLKRFFEARIS